MRRSPNLELDAPGTFDGRFDRPFRVRHTLTDHPLLTLEAVTRLAEQLPESSVEHNLADVPVLVPDGQAPRAEGSHAHVARELERGRSWMVLKNIEQVPEYAALLNTVLDDVDRLFGPKLTKRRRAGFIFLSAAGSVTPAHFDPEHNFLFQVRGSKAVSISGFPSDIVRGEELERYYSGGHRNIDWLPTDPEEVHLGPGIGVFVPLHAPHWVTVGPELSISFSATWEPLEVDRARWVSRLNHRLRRRGLSPRLPGMSAPTDQVKFALVQATRVSAEVLRRANRLVRRRTGRP